MVESMLLRVSIMPFGSFSGSPVNACLPCSILSVLKVGKFKFSSRNTSKCKSSVYDLLKKKILPFLRCHYDIMITLTQQQPNFLWYFYEKDKKFLKNIVILVCN